MIRIDEMGFPARIFGALYRAGIRTMDELKNRSDDELLAIKDIGPYSVMMVRKKIQTFESGCLDMEFLSSFIVTDRVHIGDTVLSVGVRKKAPMGFVLWKATSKGSVQFNGTYYTSYAEAVKELCRCALALAEK